MASDKKPFLTICVLESLMNFKKSIAHAVSKVSDIEASKIMALIEIPPDKKLGDFSVPCFALAKGTNPVQKASELAEKISKPKFVSVIKTAGPYLNFFLDETVFSKGCIESILREKGSYGKSEIGKGKKVMVEYSAPNTNKPLHVGHLRNDCIGMSVSRIFEFTGHKVTKANLVNDRGIHICQTMLAYQKFAEGKTPQSEGVKGDKFVGNLYVKFNQAVKENPALQEEAVESLQKWEAKDKKTLVLWKKMRSWVLGGFNETYARLGSEFDEFFFESDFYDKAKPLIELGLKKKVFEKDKNGAIIARLKKYGLSDKTVLRADGTSIYISNDLALTKYKEEKFRLDTNIWCVANEQNLYFKQLFKIFELLGFKWSKNCEHLNYGLVFLPEGKMKSREGKVIDADDLLLEIKELALIEIKKRYPKLSEKEAVERAEAISLAAIKFAMLRIDHKKDFTFVPEQSISFEGESGPYLQYTYARCKSILRKAGKSKKPDFKLLTGEKEKELLKLLVAFPETINKALESRSPHLICHYLLSLASEFNAFYHETRVIGSEAEPARLALVESVSIVLKNGLNALNISVLEEM